MEENPREREQVSGDTKFKIGGEQAERPQLKIQNDDGTPALYKVKILGVRKKQGRPNDAGEDTWYYSWRFGLLEGEHARAGVVVFGSTNDEARRSYTTNKPMKLLQLVMAVNGGQEPEKGAEWAIDDLLEKEVRVELEDKAGADGEAFQAVARFYPVKVTKVEEGGAGEVEEIDIDD